MVTSEIIDVSLPPQFYSALNQWPVWVGMLSFAFLLAVRRYFSKFTNWPFGVRVQRFCDIVLACSLFMLVGPALMMLNKHILHDLRFAFPLALSSLGLIASAVLARIGIATGAVAPVRPESAEIVAGAAWYSTVLPISITKAGTIALGNAVYMYLGLGFIQMLKAFCPAIVLSVMTLAGVPLPSRWALFSVVVIVLGTIVEVDGALTATPIGLACMFSSETFEAISLVLTQKLMHDHRFSTIEALYFLAPPGAVILSFFAALLEGPEIMNSGAFDIVLGNPWLFLAAAVLGFCVNFMSLVVVQKTSSLTLKVLNLVRCAGVVVVSVLAYGEDVTQMQLAGYIATIVGFVGYNYAQTEPVVATKRSKESSKYGGTCP